MDRTTIIFKLLSLIRYRFLLFAGIFPYILGAVVSLYYNGIFDWSYFIFGLIGMILVLIGIETLNEYLDFKIGGDRVFLTDDIRIPQYYLIIGVLAFGLAFFIALYLALMRTLHIMVFAIIGALSSIFYLSPPIQFSYRGLGEIIIFLNYGPFVTIGSYLLQAQKIDLIAILASLIPGLLILSLALINEIPDYYGDRIVGKRNIVVRLGRKKAIFVYSIAMFLPFIILIGFFLNEFSISILLIFLMLPLAYKNLKIAIRYYEAPKDLIPAIRGTISLYSGVMSLFIMSFIESGFCLV